MLTKDGDEYSQLTFKDIFISCKQRVDGNVSNTAAKVISSVLNGTVVLKGTTFPPYSTLYDAKIKCLE